MELQGSQIEMPKTGKQISFQENEASSIDSKDSQGDPKKAQPAKEAQDSTQPLRDMDDSLSSLAQELARVRAGIKSGEAAGMPNGALVEMQQSLLDEMMTLDAKQSAWLTENDKEALPEGMAIATGEENSIMKIEMDGEGMETISQKERRPFIDKWKKSAAEDFAKILKSNWRTRDAVNLSVVLDIIKNNVPLSIERKAKRFLQGETDALPESIFINWKHNSLFQRIMGEKPNQIRELKITFDGETEVLAREADLVLAETEPPTSELNDLDQAA